MNSHFCKGAFFILFLAIQFTGCVHTSTSVLSVERNYQVVDQATKKVTTTLGMEERKEQDSIPAYIRFNNGYPVYALRPIAQAQNDSVTKLTLLTMTDSQERSDNIGKALESFYRQSIDSTYVLRNPNNFYQLDTKSSSEMYRRNWISPALGIHYVGKNNPFVEKFDYSSGTVGMAMIDLLTLIPTVGGPFLGKTTGEKISISLTGLVGMIAWRVIIPWTQTRRDLEEYNKMVSSGYLLPKEIKRD
jgi:hypothetical protein